MGVILNTYVIIRLIQLAINDYVSEITLQALLCPFHPTMFSYVAQLLPLGISGQIQTRLGSASSRDVNF